MEIVCILKHYRKLHYKYEHARLQDEHNISHIRRGNICVTGRRHISPR